MDIFFAIVDKNSAVDPGIECHELERGNINEVSNDFSEEVLKKFSRYSWFLSPVISNNLIAFDSSKINDGNLLSVVNTLLNGLSSIEVSGKSLVLFDYKIGVFADPKKHKKIEKLEDWEEITEDFDTVLVKEQKSTKANYLKFIIPISVLIILILIRISPFSALLLDKAPGTIILGVCSLCFVGWIFIKYDFQYSGKKGFDPWSRNIVDNFMFWCSTFWIHGFLDLVLNTKHLFNTNPDDTNTFGLVSMSVFAFFFALYLVEMKINRNTQSKKYSKK